MEEKKKSDEEFEGFEEIDMGPEKIKEDPESEELEAEDNKDPEEKEGSEIDEEESEIDEERSEEERAKEKVTLDSYESDTETESETESESRSEDSSEKRENFGLDMEAEKAKVEQEKTEQQYKGSEETEPITEKDKKTGTTVLIATLVIIIIVIASIFLLTKFYKSDDIPSGISGYVIYNNFEFYNTSNLWTTEIQLRSDNVHLLQTRFNPYDVEHIPVPENLRDTVAQAEHIYLTVEPNLTSTTVIGMIEVGRVLGKKYNIFNIPTNGALTYLPESDYDNVTPIVNCADSTPENLVMWFKIGNTTEIYKQDDCFIIQGTDDWEVVKAADMVVFELLDIIRD